MSEVEVRTAASAEREKVIGILMLAFAADPATRWLFPGADDYLEHFPRFAAAFGGGAFGHDTAWLTADGGAASLWLPPGIASDGEALGKVVLEAVPAEELPALQRVVEQMDQHHPEEPHWYLPMIGVDPARQGRGLGSALLAKTLERVDAEGRPAYLESSNPANISLYERHGFEVVAEIRAPDGPVITPMYRQVP